MYSSDKELVDAVCKNDQDAVVYFFYKKYMAIFQYHIYKLFPYKEDIRDLVDEFFLYLYEDDWRKLKMYDPSKASLSTWISVASYRFFKNYKHSKIDSNGVVSISDRWETYVSDWADSHDSGIMMDLQSSIDSIANERDREIARLVFLEDVDPQKISDRFHLSVDYVYTVKNRLTKKLKVRLNSYR